MRRARVMASFVRPLCADSARRAARFPVTMIPMKRPVFLALATLLGASRVRAQSGYAPLVLQLPASTRALALGNADVAGRDVDVLFYNPAQLVTARGVGVAVQRYRSASTLQTMSGAIAFGSGGLGIGVQMLDFGVDPGVYPATKASLLRRGPVVASSLAATVGIGTEFKGINVGASGKYVEDRFGNARAGVAALDLGASDDYGPVTIGLAVQNIGPDLQFGGVLAQLPTRVTLGAAGGGRPVGPFDLAASTALSVLRNGRVIPAAGVELGWTWLDGYTLAARAGVRAVDGDAESPVTLGAGISVDRLTLDYSYEMFYGGQPSHRVGLRVR